MKGIMWSGLLGAGTTLIEGAKEVYNWASEAFDWASETIDWAAKEAPIAYEKAKPYLGTIKDEVIYIGLNVVGASVIGILLLGKGTHFLVRGARALLGGTKALVKRAKPLVKGIPLLAKKAITNAIGLTEHLKAGLADAWQFRNELIAEWA